MFIDFKRYLRPSLDEKQREFLHVLVPFSRMVQEQIRKKAFLSRISTTLGICSSIIAADIIVKSEWNNHKIANKYNNLTLLVDDDCWFGKSKEYEGTRYRVYDSWLDFSIDLSDYYVFNDQFKETLLAKNLDQQIDLFCLINDSDEAFRDRIELIIDKFAIWEFDLFY